MRKVLISIIPVALMAFGTANADRIAVGAQEFAWGGANDFSVSHGNEYLRTAIPPGHFGAYRASSGAFAMNAVGRNHGQNVSAFVHGLLSGKIRMSWFMFGKPADSGSETYGDFFGDYNLASNMNDGRDVSSVPEPGTLALLGFGLLALGVARRRKQVKLSQVAV